MSIQEIIKIEETNEDSIFLYKEGIFWKAYQRSAFLTVTRFRSDFMVKAKSVKCVRQKVCSIGFPLSSLTSVFVDCSIENLDEKRLRIHVDKIDEDAYQQWIDGASEKTDKAIAPLSLSDEDFVLKVLQKLKDFNVSASTPVDCMMLICELQKMIP
jgi:hypothetical protein